MKIFVSILLLLTIASPHNVYAINIHHMYGNKNKAYIQNYYKRLFKHFLDHHKQLQSCLSTQLQEEILQQVMPKYETWGDLYADEILLLPHFEVYYRSVSADSPLEAGFKLMLPVGSKVNVRGQQLSGANNQGFEFYLDHKEKCQFNTIKKEKNQLVYSNGQKLSLKSSTSASTKDYPFAVLVRGRVGEGPNAVVMLEAFNGTFLNPKMFPWLDVHKRDFYQLALRISWKSKNEFTVYYPQ